jgi:cysteine synthase A
MTGICVADPENSAFMPGWQTASHDATTEVGSRIEGIGRQRVEPSFVPAAIDRMMAVPDAASIAAIRVFERCIGRKVGASTGTGIWASMRLVDQMVRSGQQGSIVSLLRDSGDRYLDKYFSDEWLADQGIDIAPYCQRLEEFLAGARFDVDRD